MRSLSLSRSLPPATREIINYEYYEDSLTGLFQRRDPREGGPALDIERALSKLEKVALRYSDKKGRPLVLILNNVHFLKNDADVQVSATSRGVGS
ncbi:hypothetical protein BDW22DRAFT_1201370 [Trametopsis cervina]|nr:hypothetical protein BDW22DRAFT_1201370 [Trametopsis cervina]